jgi:hypothetical protein
MLVLVIFDRPAHHFVHGFEDDEAVTPDERDVRVGAGLDIANQIGIEHERPAAQSSELDHAEFYVLFRGGGLGGGEAGDRHSIG